MELLNIGFIKLLIKLTIGVMPIVLGLTFLCLSEEAKRDMRNGLCRAAFGESGAIPYAKFVRIGSILACIVILFGLVLTWFLVLSPMLSEL